MGPTTTRSDAPEGRGGRLPSGTVTLLFTDLQGSTRLVERLGSKFATVLSDHFQLLRSSIAANGGLEFGTEGDAMFAVFARARDALAAAAEAQLALAAHRWPDRVDVKVRMGLHTGTPEHGPGSYVGHDVNRAARISGAAHGGQVLLSSATRALAAPLPPGLDVIDVGLHRLKDISEPEHLFQLVGDGLTRDFPPLSTQTATPTNLPRERTSFVGRTAELDELAALLPTRRLITLTGPGGTGKTRLALHLARNALAEFPNGVWLVRLAEVQDPGLVGAAITGAMGLADVAERDPVVALGEYTRGQRHLVLLDNVEHLMSAAGTVAELLDEAPGISVVVTSREVLRIRGEQAYVVDTLPVPPAGTPMSPQRLRDIDAVRLFVDRAQAVVPGFEVDETNAGALAEVAHRLEGLPLAIELAAARVGVLSPQELATRLESRLGVLTGGPSDLPERQRTLRGAIAWSHELLGPPERRLLEQLSVFAAPVLLATAEQVTADDAEPVLDVLTSLVNKSFLRRLATPDGRSRFAMLESVKAYAQEVAEDLPRCRDEHARHYEALTEEIAADLFGPRQAELLNRAEEESADVVAAIGWCLEQGDPDRAGRIAVGMHGYWRLRAQLTTGRHLVKRVLAERPTDPVLHASLLLVAARLGVEQADFAQVEVTLAAAERLLRERGEDALLSQVLSEQLALDLRRPGGMPESRAVEAIEAFRRVHDPVGEGELRIRVGAVLAMADRRAEAVEELNSALVLMQGAGNTWGQAHALNNLGYIAATEGRFDEAEELLGSSLSMFESLNTPEGIGEAAESLAEARIQQGRLDEAVPLLERSLAIASELGFHPRMSLALAQLASCRALLGDLGVAAGDALRAAELSRTLGSDLRLDALEASGTVLAASGQETVAARLLAAATRGRAELGVPLTPLVPRRLLDQWESAELRLDAESTPAGTDDAVLDIDEALDLAEHQLRRAQPAL
ncbi:adenylate/guanylate cyclase domain-containing protein [Nostocoides sp. F2B08]|uniref:tetratricopeptide repeat protein n=1 Tax=Nostocoides sp. F2B08 TaxID=2653936 RepID=UPI00186B12CB|nr:adenylate/guanylate cyclase domain-containing protein [Tetrasphaera sp. F2B08]